MQSVPYEQFRHDELALRDLLAIDRTQLAMHRTWMATLRTGLALFVSGASIAEFFSGTWALAVAVLLITISFPVVIQGYLKYTATKTRLGQLIQRVEGRG